MALDEASFGSNPEFRPASRARFRFLTYPFRFLFRLFKRALAGFLRVFAYHPLSSLLVVALLAAVGFLGYQDYGRAILGANSVQVSSGTLPPSPAAENFIKGQETFNASLMWQSFSGSLQQALSSRGTNLQALQRELNQRKQQGARIKQVEYVGGVRTVDGSKLFMYVLTVNAPGSQGVAENHYVLTVNKNDKITKVE